MKSPKTPLKKLQISKEKKEHYRKLYLWLKEHNEIQYRKLNPYGFAIDIRTIPERLVTEFLEISTFKE